MQRPHRSNGTVLRVHLHRGVFTQFCYDPDCRAAGFRGSDELPIPAHLLPPVACRDPLPPAAAPEQDAAGNRPGDSLTGATPSMVMPSSASSASSSACATCQATAGGVSDWELSEEALATLPVDDIVASYRGQLRSPLCPWPPPQLGCMAMGHAQARGDDCSGLPVSINPSIPAPCPWEAGQLACDGDGDTSWRVSDEALAALELDGV